MKTKATVIQNTRVPVNIFSIQILLQNKFHIFSTLVKKDRNVRQKQRETKYSRIVEVYMRI